MAGICFLLGFISVLYFLGIWRMTGLSSKFPLVWLLLGSGFFLAVSFIYFGIEIPVWFSGLIVNFSRWISAIIGVFGVLDYQRHETKRSEKSGLYCGAGSAGDGGM